VKIIALFFGLGIIAFLLTYYVLGRPFRYTLEVVALAEVLYWARSYWGRNSDVNIIANLFVVGITVFLLTYYVFGRPLRYTFVVVAIGVVLYWARELLGKKFRLTHYPNLQRSSSVHPRAHNVQ
jgi:hypothetical protein